MTNPGLGPLANNGGPTQTIALLPGSLAIDAGSNAYVNATTDQRGFPRIVNGSVDIGAFERASVAGGPTVYTVDNTGTTGTGSGNSGDVVYVINQANANTNPDGSVITFDPAVFNSSSPQTINLTSTLKLSERSGSEVIQGPGASIVSISGSNAVGVFQVDSGVTASLAGLTIEDGQWTAATATPGSSGGGGIDNFGILAVTGCTIEDSSAAGANSGDGGGIANEFAGLLTVTDSTIQYNSAGSGGGVFNVGWMVVTGSTFSSNSADGQGGGLDNYGLVFISDCLVNGNHAGGGGGIYNASELFLTSSTVAGNQAGVGGGGGFEDNSLRFASGLNILMRPLVTDCTIADNQSGGGGGGIEIDARSGLIISNTLIVRNTDSQGPDDFYTTGFFARFPYIAMSYDMVGVDKTGILTNGINGNLVGVADPGLGLLADNGGPTQTMALLPGSPAIDAGSNAFVNATTDQRSRPARSGRIERGAERRYRRLRGQLIVPGHLDRGLDGIRHASDRGRLGEREHQRQSGQHHQSSPQHRRLRSP